MVSLFSLFSLFSFVSDFNVDVDDALNIDFSYTITNIAHTTPILTPTNTAIPMSLIFIKLGPFINMKHEQTATATATNKGRIFLLLFSGSIAPKIDFAITTCNRPAVNAPTRGDATQATNVLTIAAMPKLAGPRATNPTATKPPTMECVADIGSPYIVANKVVTPAPANTHNMPNAKVAVPSQPSALYAFGSMTPFEIVFATDEPMVIAPIASKMAPNTNACFNVNAFAPTEVPIELAMSFAPFAKARITAPITPSIINVSVLAGCIA